MSASNSDSGSDSMPISIPNSFKMAEDAHRFHTAREENSNSSTESDAISVEANELQHLKKESEEVLAKYAEPEEEVADSLSEHEMEENQSGE